MIQINPNNKSSLPSHLKIDYLFLFVFIIMLFSHNFHFLWLIYDLLALFGIIYICQYFKPSMALLLFSTTFLYNLLLALLTNIHLISFLSIWDNLKHYFVIFMVMSVISRTNLEKANIFFSKLKKTITISFYLSFFVVLFQFFSGFHFDNIAGIFGDGGTHALGFLILINFIFALFDNKNIFYLFFIFILSVLMIVLGEITAILPFLLFLTIYFRPRISIFILFFFIMIFVTSSDFRDFVNMMFYRYIAFMSYDDIDQFSKPYHRSAITLYVWHLGGLFGLGPGSISDIYGFEGWELYPYTDYQLSISTFTHSLAEIGLIGYLLLTSAYVLLLISYLKSLKNKLLILILFIAFTLYNRILMDERIILLFLVFLIIIKMKERNDYK